MAARDRVARRNILYLEGSWPGAPRGLALCRPVFHVKPPTRIRVRALGVGVRRGHCHPCEITSLSDRTQLSGGSRSGLYAHRLPFRTTSSGLLTMPGAETRTEAASRMTFHVKRPRLISVAGGYRAKKDRFTRPLAPHKPCGAESALVTYTAAPTKSGPCFT